MNLYEETIGTLLDLGLTAADVAWVGTPSILLDTESFWECARRTDYDNGFGSQEIALDLLIVLDDGSWLEREEYDGAEQWAYKRVCERPACAPVACTALDARGVGLVGWETLGSILSKAERAGMGRKESE